MHLALKETIMSLKNSSTTAQRKADGIRRLIAAREAAKQAGTLRQVSAASR